ncbi:MAG: LPS export ABC transporter periplasmic protein LptC [candidate division Zixibacteria bacterium]|nr:LPS export ABC transporter periplasmic protein LptC [candidate division Zixibacteria bacterium]
MNRLIDFCRNTIVIICLCFTFVSPLYAGEKGSSPIELIHSDYLEVNNDKDNLILNLIGNVQFKQDSTFLSSGRAIWYKSAGQVILIENVFLDDGKGGTLSSDRATYYRSSRKLTALGNVVATADSQRVIVTGRKGEYHRDSEYVRVTGTPKLVARTKDDTTAVVITADTLEYDGIEDIGYATDSVTIVKGKLNATGGRAEFHRKDEYAALFEEPVAIQEDSKLEGDTIWVYTTEQKVERIAVRGDARALHHPKPDSTHTEGSNSILTGKELDFYFSNDKPDSAVVVGTATSIYQPAKSETSSEGTNEASGDTIKFYIENEDLKRALVYGGAKGNYRFRPEDAPADSVVEDTVWYNANNINYIAEDSSIFLNGFSKVIYEKMNLNAESIVFVTSDNYIFAQGDSIHGKDSSFYKNPPILKEGDEKIIGYKMEYNIKNKKGRITYGDTEFDKGFYGGEDLRKVTDEVLYVKNGVYTSCNLLEPHYSFKSSKMKLIAREKVVARPVVMYIGDLPVAALPYYVFPIKKGRHSGFTPFEIGNFERGDRFIRNVGYYWAASEYWDLESTFDYFEDNHTALNLTGRYVVRYKLSGRISSSYVHESRFSGMTKVSGQKWRLDFNHSQILSETASLKASGSFFSDRTFIDDISLDPEEILKRNIHSHISLNKEIAGDPLVIALDHNRNLDTDAQTATYPLVTYSRSNRPLIPFIEPKKKGVEKERSWYHELYYRYNFRGNNYLSTYDLDDIEHEKRYLTANHRIHASAPLKLMGLLTLSPNANYDESWYYIPSTNISDSSIVETEAFKRKGIYDFGASAKTELYGLFTPNLGIVKAFRHVMTPTASYTWQPEFKDNEEYSMFTGVGNSGSKRNSISFSLANTFQMKGILKNKEFKFDLCRINFNTGYNFIGEGRKWSNLNTTINSNTIRRLSLTGGMIHNFYSNTPADKTPDFLHPRMTSFNISVSYSLNGKTSGQSSSDNSADETDIFRRRRNPELPTQSPWILSFSGYYNENRVSKSIRRWIKINYETPITQSWRIKYDCNYDIEKKEITDQEVQITRNIHCWQGSFVWRPGGRRPGYYLKINVIDLPDIKVEKSEGGIKGRGYY